MEHMEKRKRNSETAGAAAQGGTPAGSRKHAAEPQGRRMERGAVAPGSAWALVTGAGSGIGRCYALRLAALGYRLVIAGDNRAPLEAVAEEIRNARPAGRKAAAKEPEAAEGSEVAKKSKVAEGLGVAASADGSGAPGREPAAAIAEATGEPGAETDGNGALAAGSAQQGVGSGKECGNRATAAVTPDVRVIAIDLARVGAAQELYDRMTAEGIVVDVVINNAGIFSFCDILATPAERIERIILLHDLTVTQLCRLFAADMVRRGVRGHILNMSSYSLWMPFPGLALYSASKAYMRSFSVAFAKEVRERGIRVTALCPAGVATDLYGLTPYWQRIGRKLGVLITPRQLCAPRAEGVVERPPLHRTRLVEPRLDPLLQGIADVGAAAGAAFHDEVPKIRRNDAGSHRRKRAVLPGSTRHRHGLRRRGEAGSSTAEPNSADAAHGQDIR